MSKQKTVAVYIGRFQPFHYGHKSIIDQAGRDYDEVVVVVGSALSRTSPKNPQTYNERARIIETVCPDVTVLPVQDFLYQERRWEREVMSIVTSVIPNARYQIVGFEKDDSSYYVKNFPQWGFKAYPAYEHPGFGVVNATDIRKAWLNYNAGPLSTLCPSVVMETAPYNTSLGDPALTRFNILREEVEYYEAEDKKFEHYPYPETLKFVCSDALVTCRGYALLIQRKYAPGRDCWALPGGFVNRSETFAQCALRELDEETNIKVPEKVIAGSFVSSHVFDSPNRGLGIPRITNCFYYDIEPNHDGKLPKVKPGDDAKDAKWISLAELKTTVLYDDHRDIVEFFVG